MRLPLRKSPCTTTSPERGGRVSASHRSPSSKAGWGWPRRSSRPRSCSSGVPAGEPRHLGGRDAVDGGQHLPALPGQTGPHRGQPLVAQDSAGDGLTVDEFHDHEGGPEPVGASSPATTTPGTGTPARPAACRREASSRSPDDRRPGRVAPQDEAPGDAAGPCEREAPRLAGGAAGQPGHVVHHHRAVEDRDRPPVRSCSARSVPACIRGH